jgi:hypothetical protein
MELIAIGVLVLVVAALIFMAWLGNNRKWRDF